MPHIGNCITLFTRQQPSIQKNELVRTEASVFEKTYKVLFPRNISRKHYYQYFELSSNLVASSNYILIGKKNNCPSLLLHFFTGSDMKRTALPLFFSSSLIMTKLTASVIRVNASRDNLPYHPCQNI